MDGDIVRGFGDGMRIGRMIGDAISGAFLVLSRPLSLLTQVFYRKSMGERYFTALHAGIGFAILLAVTLGSRYLIPITTRPANSGFGSVAIYSIHPWTVYGVGVVWMAIFLVAYSRHQLKIKQRYATGERWHSMNSGIPRLPPLTNSAQYGVSLAIAVAAMYFGLYGYGILLALSLASGAASDLIAARRFWASVLDSVDGQIEAENLSRAVLERLSPARVEGIEAPLPRFISPAYRSRIAKALTREASHREGAAWTVVVPQSTALTSPPGHTIPDN